LSNLLRSPRWSAKRLADTLWQQADAHVQALRASGEEPFLEWDGRVLEKPETIKNDDLCALRSSKARRLKRIRPGFFNPPGGRPICVPGLHWLGLLVLGRAGAPTVAAMHGWTRRGERASDQQPQVQQLLRRSVEAWGGDVRHLWDREFASGRWLRLMLDVNIRFVLRWKKRQKLHGWLEHAVSTPDPHILQGDEDAFPTFEVLEQRWTEEERAMRDYLARLSDDDLTDYVRYTTPEERSGNGCCGIAWCMSSTTGCNTAAKPLRS
jgi:hypothetical protein